jgi:hypothetical protein
MESLRAFGLRWQLVVLAALSLSVGWGIRGNFGHEWGAAFPGALTAMAVVLLSGRTDWWRRVHYFAVFGAIGWSFGGSISYMIVIGYTHSGDSLSVWYGFVCLFIIGFLWGAMGGAGTALPAYLDRKRLTEFFFPILAIFLTFWVSEMIANAMYARNPGLEDRLDWFDTDWGAVLLVIAVTLARAAVMRKLDRAGSLILHMAVGWWIAFLLFPVLLNIRMTPPRGDSWAGCVGMVAGMFLYLQRNGLPGVSYAALVSGFIGGLGFASAALIKLIAIKSGYETNWHSVLEQTYGAINGIGMAVALALPMRHAPSVSDDPPVRRWTEPLAVALILLLLTYVNLQKVVNDWVKSEAVPETLYFLTARGWFDLGYLGIALTGSWLLWEHTRRPFALVPPTWLGKGQMLYLALLWWMVIGNLFRAIVSFTPQRLITEGVIHWNALLCTLFVLLWTRERPREPVTPLASYTPFLKKALLVGLIGMVVTTTLDWAMIRAVWGNTFVGHANLHIRFGPNATTQKR